MKEEMRQRERQWERERQVGTGPREGQRWRTGKRLVKEEQRPCTMSNDLPTDNFSGNAAKSLHSGMSWGQSYRWGGGEDKFSWCFSWPWPGEAPFPPPEQSDHAEFWESLGALAPQRQWCPWGPSQPLEPGAYHDPSWPFSVVPFVTTQ